MPCTSYYLAVQGIALRLTVGFISPLAGGGGHEPVQLRILGDGVGERHQGAADP